MQRILLKSKIHRATVTAAALHYRGSLTLDRELMEAADLCEFEQVQIYNITSGTRLTTYVLAGSPGNGTVQINGAAAHLVHPGDLIIIASYAQYSEEEVRAHRPRVVLVDEENRPAAAGPAVASGRRAPRKGALA